MNDSQGATFSNNYLQALIQGDSNKAAEAISAALNLGASPAKVYLRILMPALVEVDGLSRSGKLGVAEEHLASQITLHEMTRLRQMIKPKAPLGKRAVVATIDGDTHFIGSRVVADFLFMDGWEVDFLGTITPSADLIKFVTERKVDLVGLSATSSNSLENLKQMIGQLHQLPNSPRVIIGGPAINPLENGHLSALGADGAARDALETINLARKVCGLSESQASLTQYLKSLGERIHGNRKQRQMTQQELADTANLDRAYISSVEHGKQNMTIGAIYKLSQALEVPLEDLLVGEQQ